MNKPDDAEPKTHTEAAKWLLSEALAELDLDEDPIATVTRALAHLYADEGSIPRRIVLRGRRVKPDGLMQETSEVLEDVPSPFR